MSILPKVKGVSAEKEISNRLGWKKKNGKYEAIIDSAANQRTLASEKSVSELFYENGISKTRFHF